VGDRTELCDTPAFISLGVDISPSTETMNFSCEKNELIISRKQKQKLTAGNQPARSHLASGPAATHDHIFVQCQDLCFSFLSLILLIDKGGIGLFIYINWCSVTTPYST
jgi:hypothetical protein